MEGGGKKTNGDFVDHAFKQIVVSPDALYILHRYLEHLGVHPSQLSDLGLLLPGRSGLAFSEELNIFLPDRR